MKEEIEKLPDIEELGYSFKNKDLLREALTHTSFAVENSLPYDNQRLEFFGDSVVQIVITEYLYHKYPDLREGNLTKMRSFLTQTSTLAKFAEQIGISSFIKLGRGEINSGGATRQSTLCNAFEALCAAIYLDSGLEAAKSFIIPLVELSYPFPEQMLAGFNPKGYLQEFLQGKGMNPPEYKIESENGPSHAKTFVISVIINGEKISTAVASNKKAAEAKAAEEAIKILLSNQNNLDKK